MSWHMTEYVLVRVRPERVARLVAKREDNVLAHARNLEAHFCRSRTAEGWQVQSKSVAFFYAAVTFEGRATVLTVERNLFEAVVSFFAVVRFVVFTKAGFGRSYGCPCAWVAIDDKVTFHAATVNHVCNSSLEFAKCELSAL